MSCKKKETATVVSQEQLANGIYSMWLQTEEIAGMAVPGQFISMYPNDGSKLLPRPISLCEINKEKQQLRVVYRVTGEGTGTEQFSQMAAGDTIDILGPLGNGFPLEEGKGKKAFLMGGGIGVPPILELAKQLDCEKKQIVVGYRDAETFLKKNLKRTARCTFPQKMAVLAQREMSWMQSGKMYWMRTLSMPVDRHRCFVQSNSTRKKMISYVTFPWRRGWHAESEHVWHACVSPRKKTTTAM